MLILASASPRREELLRLITADFAVVTMDTDETVPPGTGPEETVLELARRKALAVAAARPEDTVIGADTVVAVDGEILGKPRDEAEAAAMLGRLSGRRHMVFTGVAIIAGGRCRAFAEHAEVEFIPLRASQISAYVATGEPMDKAGAYGIQGKGALYVRGITGDFYTVMGLPVCRLAGILEEISVNHSRENRF